MHNILKRLGSLFFIPLSSQMRRRADLAFTIVELLIVIVIIGILAAIVIVSYSNTTKRALEASMRSDIENSVKQIEAYNAINGSYPSVASVINDGQGLKVSQGNALTYVTKPYGYCLSASDPAVSKIYVWKSNNGQIVEGTCDTIVTTLAGSGDSYPASGGFADGVGSVARFNMPYSTAVDSTGNIYVADSNNNRIRKVTPTGVVSTLAGSGVAGFADGVGAAAQFNNPSGVAVDTSGNIYVADTSNYRVRVITPAGVVTTLAGSGVGGHVDGTGVSALLYYIEGIAVDDKGVVYVAESGWGGKDYIRKISPTGVVTTIAGGDRGYADGIGAAAKFNQPYGVAVDRAGVVYVADNNNNVIRKITLSGEVTTIAGKYNTWGFVDGPAATAEFNFPSGITVGASGTLYVVDNYCIRFITPDGVVGTLAGSHTDAGYADGDGAIARFGWLESNLSVDSAENVYIADMDNYRIRKIIP